MLIYPHEIENNQEYLSYLGNITWQKYDEKYVKGYHKKT